MMREKSKCPGFLITLCLILIPHQAHADLRNGLVGWWTMNEGTGTVTYDKSGQGNNGTLTGAGGLPVWTAQCKRGNCLQFDGVDDYVNMGDVLDTTFAGANAKFTLSAWVKPNSATMTNNVIIGKYDATDNVRELFMRLSTSSRVEFLWYGDAVGTSHRSAIGATSITNTSMWYHIVVLYDGTAAIDSRITIYVNGGNDSATLNLTQGTPASIADTSATLEIGSANKARSAIQFNGYIDDVRIYNRVLSAQDVHDLYIPGVMLRNGVVRNGSIQQ